MTHTLNPKILKNKTYLKITQWTFITDPRGLSQRLKSLNTSTTMVSAWTGLFPILDEADDDEAGVFMILLLLWGPWSLKFIEFSTESGLLVFSSNKSRLTLKVRSSRVTSLLTSSFLNTFAAVASAFSPFSLDNLLSLMVTPILPLAFSNILLL